MVWAGKPDLEAETQNAREARAIRGNGRSNGLVQTRTAHRHIPAAGALTGSGLESSQRYTGHTDTV